MRKKLIAKRVGWATLLVAGVIVLVPDVTAAEPAADWAIAGSAEV